MSTELEQIEEAIDSIKNNIAFRDKLRKLRGNTDFHDIIDKGYFTDEAARLVAAKCNPNMQSTEMQSHLDRMIMGVGALQQYFYKIELAGNAASDKLSQYEDTRTEIMREIA